MDQSIFEFGQVISFEKSDVSKTSNRMANNVAPDEMSPNEPPHLNLHSFATIYILLCEVDKVKN